MPTGRGLRSSWAVREFVRAFVRTWEKPEPKKLYRHNVLALHAFTVEQADS